MQRFFTSLGTVFSLLFGRMSWSAPPWVRFLVGLPRQYPRHVLGALIIALLLGGGIAYYLQLPIPLRYLAQVSGPRLTPVVDEVLQPQPLTIAFDYDPDYLAETEQSLPEVSLANMMLLDKPITQGIRLQPALAGEWRWQDDQTLVFNPEEDWPAGQTYLVHLSKSLFRDGAKLKDESVSFTTPPFNAEIVQFELYQEPGGTSREREGVATLSFSHPVDKASLEAKLSAQLIETPVDEGKLKLRKRKLAVTLEFDKLGRTAYLHTEPVAIMDYPNRIELVMATGVTAAKGGATSESGAMQQVDLPDSTHLFKVSELSTMIVPNKQEQPEQILSLEFSDEVAHEQLSNQLEVRLLPERNKPWPLSEAIQAAKDSPLVSLSLVPNERDSASRYSARMDVPEGRTLLVSLKPELTSVGGFQLVRGYRQLVDSPRYPQELKITGDGSVLTMSGEHRLGLLSRNLQAVRVQIDRVLPDQINHLVSQTYGDIRNPAFSNYQFSEPNLSQHEERIIDLVKRHPREANYAAFDLSPYLQASNTYGLFFVNVEGWDPNTYTSIEGLADRRLILVTDLGLIVKDNADTTHDLFVQSISNGKPVAGAEITLLGLNGKAVMMAKTDADGHAQLAATDGLDRGRAPTVYLVRHGSDVSFLPFNRAERTLNYSRFDVGGVYSAHQASDTLNAFLFSDRGIYRPGEQVNLGAIVRRMDLKVPSAIPLEMEILNPRGAVVMKRRLTLPKLGFLDMSFQTEATSETGYYNVELYAIHSANEQRGYLGSVTFQLEEFQPDRLKIDTQLLGELGKGWSSAKQLQMEVSLRNLFGTPAETRKVTGQMSLIPTGFQFAEFPGYHFDDPLSDPDKPRPAVHHDLLETQTDADGLARFNLPLDEFAQGTYRLTLNVEGFEEGGGRSVHANASLLLSPLEALVGVKQDGDLEYIHQDAERALALIALNHELEPITLDSLQLRLLERQSISTLVRQNNGTLQYQSVMQEKPLLEEKFSIQAQGGRYLLPSDRPGDFVFELINAQGQRLARVPFHVVGAGNLAGTLEKNAELQVKLDKKDYRPGELIEMNITAPYTGSGLITIETDQVHTYKWFTSETTSSVQTIRLPEGIEGNAYVNLAFVRAADSPEIYVSPLSYAVAPFSINRKAREIDIGFDLPETARPGKPMSIGYHASKKSRMVVFAVDEGILQVANYQTPQPLDFFLRKKALEVNTQQLIDLILPEFEQILRRSASGGDMLESIATSNLNPFVRKVNQPAVFWAGIVDADPQTRSVSFPIPDTFSGQLRVMAVAVSDTAMGMAEQKVLVRGPFVISPNLLTTAAPGDEFNVSVGVANLVEGSGDQAAIQLSVLPSEGLEIIGDAETTLTLGEGREGRHRFRVRAKERPGEASLTFLARLGEEEGRISASLSVRPAIPYRSEFSSGYANDGRAEVPLTRQLYPQLATQEATASSSPLVLIDGLHSYLDNFPHGCTEQIVSQIFPLIALSSQPGYAGQQPDIHHKVEALINQLRTRQVASGGFNLWSGEQEAADFPSVYAMHFLVEAREAGFSVPNDLFDSGQEFLRELARRSVSDLESARISAQAIYLLTRSGQVTSNLLLGLHEWLQKQQKGHWKQDLSAAYLAATYAMLKKNDEAEKLIDGYHIGTGDWAVYSDFHSPLTLDAQYVTLLAKHFPKRLKALTEQEIRQLVEPVFGGHYNTLGSAYTILALSAYGQAVSAAEQDAKIVFRVRLLNGDTQILATQTAPFPHIQPTLKTRSVSIVGGNALFYLTSQVGFDRDLPKKSITKGLEIQREYLDEQGKVVSEFHQGMEITVRLRIRATNRNWVSNVAVIDLMPGGFEVIRSSVPRQYGDWSADYVDVREDRVVFYGGFGSRVTELTYQAKVTAAGSFTLPPAYAESMYDRRIQGQSTAGQLEIIASE
ncbi:MAG: MG2 domain-containing protein [Candidatus Thiodiazotropha sp.]